MVAIYCMEAGLGRTDILTQKRVIWGIYILFAWAGYLLEKWNRNGRQEAASLLLIRTYILTFSFRMFQSHSQKLFAIMIIKGEAFLFFFFLIAPMPKDEFHRLWSRGSQRIQLADFISVHSYNLLLCNIFHYIYTIYL